MVYKKSARVLIICLFLALSAFAGDDSDDKSKFTFDVVEKRTPVSVPKALAEPVIDGNLGDEIWKTAAKLDNFIQTNPGDNTKPSRETIVYITYDSKSFYIAFKCFDEPDKIRATVAARDSVFGEDNVRIFLDTYDDKQRAYVIGFNPLGIQQDGILNEGSGTDFNFDILMESKGVIGTDGWTVEAKIPFKSLRYSAGKGKSWGLHVWRNIDRFNDEIDSWQPNDRNVASLLTQMGKITGLEDIETAKTIEIAPNVTLKETGRRISENRFGNPAPKGDFGFTAKLQLASNITLDAAYNPDFADVEADAPVVQANNRFPIFFSEKRPFFLEGIETFKTRIQAVHTRTIEDPDLAVKLSGRIGKNSFGVFGAVDEPISRNPLGEKAYVGVMRLKRDFGKSSNFGFIGTTYNYPNKHNNVAGFDVRWRKNDQTTFIAQVLGSTSGNFFYDPTQDSARFRTGNGLNYDAIFAYEGKHLSYGIGSRGITRDFRADVGFISRRDTIQHYGFIGYATDTKPKAFIIQKNFNTSAGYRHNAAGRMQSFGWDTNLNLTLRGNMYFNTGGYTGKEVLFEHEFGPSRTATQAGAFFGAADRHARQGGHFMSLFKNFSKRFTASANYSVEFNAFDFDFGAGLRFPRVSPGALADPRAPIDPGTGRNFNGGIELSIKPIDTLSFDLSYNKSILDRYDTGRRALEADILSVRSTYQFSRFVWLKTRLDFDSLSDRVFGQYTFGWTPSPGKALYVGYNDGWLRNIDFGNGVRPQFYQMDRTFFIKLSYLFRKTF